jgi:hypothetical protein
LRNSHKHLAVAPAARVVASYAECADMLLEGVKDKKKPNVD